MKTNNKKYFGIDASNEISLLEYGLLVKANKDRSFDIIFKTGDTFQTTQMTNQEINEIPKESWFDKDTFFSYVGVSYFQWVKMNVANKLHDLLQYYGYQTIFGDFLYEGMSMEEATKKYLS